jgi:thiol-disulfide isomerase/thioredoxin
MTRRATGTLRGWMAGALALAGLTTLAASGGLLAQDEPSLHTWYENFDYVTEVDGAVSTEARLFSTQGKGAMLIVAPELAQAIVLELKGRTVMLVEASALKEGMAPDTYDIDDAAIHGPPAPYTMDGNKVIFFYQGKRVQLSRRAPLLGATTMQEMLTYLPAYRKGMKDYVPMESDVVYLKSYKLPVRIEVFFGSWCPHCKVTVPKFLKVVEQMANPNVEVTFTAVPVPPFADYPPAKAKDIKGVPTFILYGDGKEVGRITTIAGDSSIEHELVKILFAFQQAKG